MNWKEILKPNIGKGILFFILAGSVNFVSILLAKLRLGGDTLLGVPLGFLPMQNNVLDVMGIPHIGFQFINFTIDVAFWYLLSCSVISICNKIRK